MVKPYAPLATTPLQENNTYAHPKHLPEFVRINDPALDIVIDFHEVQPIVAGPREKISNNLVCRISEFPAILVVEDDRVVGIVTNEDLQGEKPLQISQDRRIPRAEILLIMIMTPRHKILAIDYEELRHTKISNVISTLRDHKQHYALVVDSTNPEEQVVVGLISAVDIGRRLGKDITSQLTTARSIDELLHDLH